MLPGSFPWSFTVTWRTGATAVARITLSLGRHGSAPLHPPNPRKAKAMPHVSPWPRCCVLHTLPLWRELHLACLPVCLPACPPPCLPAHLALSTCLSTCLPCPWPGCLHACLPECCSDEVLTRSLWRRGARPSRGLVSPAEGSARGSRCGPQTQGATPLSAPGPPVSPVPPCSGYN